MPNPLEPVVVDLHNIASVPDWGIETKEELRQARKSGRASKFDKADIESVRQNIISNIGTLSPARYEVYIHGIPERTISEQIGLQVETVSLPGRSVSTQPARTYGPIREMPYEKLYTGDLQITFRVGGEMTERTLFETWLDEVVAQKSHDFKYYGINHSGYAKSMEICHLDNNDAVVYNIELREVYPKAVEAIELGADKTDEYTKQVVTFAFRDYKVISSIGSKYPAADITRSLENGAPVVIENVVRDAHGRVMWRGDDVVIGSGELPTKTNPQYERLK